MARIDKSTKSFKPKILNSKNLIKSSNSLNSNPINSLASNNNTQSSSASIHQSSPSTCNAGIQLSSSNINQNNSFASITQTQSSSSSITQTPSSSLNVNQRNSSASINQTQSSSSSITQTQSSSSITQTQSSSSITQTQSSSLNVNQSNSSNSSYSQIIPSISTPPPLTIQSRSISPISTSNQSLFRPDSSPPNSNPSKNQSLVQNSPQSTSNSSNHLSAAEKMKMKARAAKAARAIEKLNNPNSSRRSTSVTSSATSINNFISNDILVPTLTPSINSSQTSLNNNNNTNNNINTSTSSVLSLSSQIDPSLDTATLTHDTTLNYLHDTLSSTDNDIPVLTQNRSSSSSISKNKKTRRKPISSSIQSQSPQLTNPSMSSITSNPVNHPDQISSRLKRKRHLDELRQKKKRSIDPNLSTHQTNQNLKKNSNSSKKKLSTHSSQNQKLDSPFDLTTCSMAELSKFQINQGKSSEILEARMKLVIERRDREKAERKIERDKLKIRKPISNPNSNPEKSSQPPENLSSQPNHKDPDKSVEENLILDHNQISPKTATELKENHPDQELGSDDSDSDDDLEDFEEVVFDQFAHLKKSQSSKSKPNPLQSTSTEPKQPEPPIDQDVDLDDYLPEPTQFAPQLRVVDGQIILDQDSLQVNRADQPLQLEEMEIVEESDSTRLVNSQTWGKTVRADKWSATETSLFYDAVRLFGSDFEMIAQLFPGRTRRQIRTKWTREERSSPKEITDALLGRRPSSTTIDSPLTPIAEDESETGNIILPTKLKDFAEYAKIVGIDCSGPMPVDPMDKWRLKERLEDEELRKAAKKKDDETLSEDPQDPEEDDSRWGEQ
ncbi:hypothetical protein O181_023695 [Austropuccinia psidii MF-1]|uniref:Myb-like domain-containing protein n=1 Tax=Austropuccinia psidii MF-1 TaxID=1389203 RepID=A0A9Q3CJ14_9BASI|nr:hypothetical protein [Austropuccinia psidii MF-1]